MWLKGTFHLEICNFLVLLALHNYVSCHLSHCGVPRQICFSYIYHITGKHRDRFNQLLYTKWRPLLTGDIQQLFEDLSWTDSAPRGFFPQLLWNWDFPLNYSTAFQKEELRPICFLQQVHRVNWEWCCCRGTPSSLGIGKQWGPDGTFRHEAG